MAGYQAREGHASLYHKYKFMTGEHSDALLQCIIALLLTVVLLLMTTVVILTRRPISDAPAPKVPPPAEPIKTSFDDTMEVTPIAIRAAYGIPSDDRPKFKSRLVFRGDAVPRDVDMANPGGTEYFNIQTACSRNQASLAPPSAAAKAARDALDKALKQVADTAAVLAAALPPSPSDSPRATSMDTTEDDAIDEELAPQPKAAELTHIVEQETVHQTPTQHQQTATPEQTLPVSEGNASQQTPHAREGNASQQTAASVGGPLWEAFHSGMQANAAPPNQSAEEPPEEEQAEDHYACHGAFCKYCGSDRKTEPWSTTSKPCPLCRGYDCGNLVCPCWGRKLRRKFYAYRESPPAKAPPTAASSLPAKAPPTAASPQQEEPLPTRRHTTNPLFQPPPVPTKAPPPPNHTSMNSQYMDRYGVSMRIKAAHNRDNSGSTVEDMVRQWGWREFHQTHNGIAKTGKIHLRQDCATCFQTSRWWQFTNGEVRANYDKSICNPCLDYQQKVTPIN